MATVQKHFILGPPGNIESLVGNGATIIFGRSTCNGKESVTAEYDTDEVDGSELVLAMGQVGLVLDTPA